MSSAAAATPKPAGASSPERVIADTLAGQLDGVEAALSKPVHLFSKDNDVNNAGDVDMLPPATQAKCPASPTKKASQPAPSPARKKVNASSTPKRSKVTEKNAPKKVAKKATSVAAVASLRGPSPTSIAEPIDKPPSTASLAVQHSMGSCQRRVFSLG